MSCTVTFNGRKFEKSEFLDFVKSGQHMSGLLTTNVSPYTQARFETLGVSTDTQSKYRPIAINKASRILNSLKDALISGKEHNKELIYDILKVHGVITSKKFHDKYWVKSEINLNHEIITSDKSNPLSRIAQPKYFDNLDTLRFLQEAYPFFIRLTNTKSNKATSVEISTEFTPAAAIQSFELDPNMATNDNESNPGDGLGASNLNYDVRHANKEAQQKAIKDIKLRIKRLRELIAKHAGNELVHLDKIEELTADLERLKAAGSDIRPILYSQANQDIVDVKKLLQRENLSFTELTEAILTMGVWQKLADTLGEIEEELDPALQKIVNDATNLRKKLVEIGKQVIIDQDKSGKLDLNQLEYMKDDSWRKSISIDLLSSTNEFIQHIAKFINAAAIERDNDIKEKLEHLEHYKKTLSFDERSMIFQRDSEGRTLYNSLVNRYSDKWWDRLKFLSALSKRSEGSDDDSKEGKKIVREFLRKNQATLDPSIFMRNPDGSYSVSDNKRREAIQNFIDDVGDEDHAREMIAQGERKYEYFREAKSQYEEYLDTIHSGITDTVERNKVKAESLRNWVRDNDPNVYYTYYYAPAFRQDIQDIYGTVNPGYNKYLVTTPKRFVDGKETEWYDKQFDKVKSNSKLYEFYQFVLNTMKEGKRNLPSYALAEDQSNYVYRTRASLGDVLRQEGILTVLKKIKNVPMDWVAAEYEDDHVEQTDPITGRPIGSVPVTVLQNIDKKIDRLEYILQNLQNTNLTEAEITLLREELNNLKTSYSKDILSSLEAFIHMSENYKWMSSIHDKVLMARTIIDSAKEITSSGSKEGLINTKAALDYNIEAMIYGKYKDVEGQSNKGKKWKDNIFTSLDLIPLVNSKKSKRAHEIAKILEAEEEPVQRIIDKLNSGVEPSEEEIKRLNNFRSLDREYKSLGGKRLTWSTIADTMIKFTGLKAIGFSIQSSMANLTFGIGSNFVHAVGNTDFSEKEALEAFTLMLHSTKKYMSFNRADGKISNKITNVMDKLNVITEIMDTKYGQHTTKSTLRKTVDPYAWFRSTDFFMKGQTTIACLKHIKFENGNNLWDCLDEKGNLIKSMVPQEYYDQWLKGGRIELTQRLIKVSKIIHGNGDNNSPIRAKKYMFGRLVGQFRLSWLAEGVESRFASKYYNTTLGRDLEGRYVTAWHLAQDYSKNFLDTKQGSMGVFKRLVQTMQKRPLTELEKSNLKMVMADAILIASLYGLMVLIKSATEDDDDPHPGSRLVFNLLYRTQQDAWFYTSPQIFQTFTGRLVPAMSVFTDFQDAFSKTQDYLSDDGNATGQDAINKWMKSFPVTRQVYNLNRDTQTTLDKLKIR